MNEIELEIKKIQEQRNYDIELINKNYNVNNDSWLTSQDTSIKNEKLTFSFKQNMDSNTNNANSNIASSDKHITWSNENKFY